MGGSFWEKSKEQFAGGGTNLKNNLSFVSRLDMFAQLKMGENYSRQCYKLTVS